MGYRYTAKDVAELNMQLDSARTECERLRALVRRLVEIYAPAERRKVLLRELSE